MYTKVLKYGESIIYFNRLEGFGTNIYTIYNDDNFIIGNIKGKIIFDKISKSEYSKIVNFKVVEDKINFDKKDMGLIYLALLTKLDRIKDLIEYGHCNDEDDSEIKKIEAQKQDYIKLKNKLKKYFDDIREY